MDFQQRKLIKSEWESIEIPVSADEIDVLNLIREGHQNVNIKINKANSLFSLLKIEYTEQLEDYLYKEYFAGIVGDFIKKYGQEQTAFLRVNVNVNVTIKKADLIRIQKNTVESLRLAGVYEYVLLEHMDEIFKKKTKKRGVESSENWMYHYFTLYKLSKCNVLKINRHVLNLVEQLLSHFEDSVDFSTVIENAVDYIEKNKNLLKFADMMLYEHQKEIFTVCKNKGPKLVLYIAPTGTGKTLTPIGLSQQHRIIFVCAARHVGLALAKAAISVNKRVAFAFGCASADDIRLHYFAAKDYTKNWKSGGIWKVDNTAGERVEIMICDIKSYLPAMYYMLSFNESHDIITYWDEPTITLDYPSHEFHDIIQKNWSENLIPNMILSSATLPKLHELPDTTNDFQRKFPGAKIYNIVSHDCKKSIPMLNKDGYVVLPHGMSENYEEVLKMVEHCENYLTLLRYFDLSEVVKCILFANKTNCVAANMKIARYFTNLEEVTMTNIKLYYLQMLKRILPGMWGILYMGLYRLREKKIVSHAVTATAGQDASSRLRKIVSVGPGLSMATSTSSSAASSAPIIRTTSEQLLQSGTGAGAGGATSSGGTFGLYVTTKDAHTLTDGPTIFLANDVDKIAKFCIQQANIPVKVMEEILEKIEFNNKVNERIGKMERNMEDAIQRAMDKAGATDEKTKKLERVTDRVDSTKMRKELDSLYGMVKTASLNEAYIPNKQGHLKKWVDDPCHAANAFTSDITESTINKIMMLSDVSNHWKILLLLGIGVFTNQLDNADYIEIMKDLAVQQKLYMIIASSDYIYGTNYQFCHGYLSKDMNLTQEKIIQAMGRIGRNNVQQNYTVRFRDDEQILRLFTADAEKPEIANMNRLFNSA
jgi:hypothetical protein